MTELRCAACQVPLEPGDHFCENCGARQVEPEPDEARVELDLQAAAAVSDRGRLHRRNEDAFELQIIDGHGIAAVVCDGISTASAPDAAARDAAKAAADVLAEALTDPSRDARAAIVDAIAEARAAVERVPWTTRADRAMPSCTLVCALCREDRIAIGSVGDSRAYWIDAAETIQLTVDDSWAQEQIADGRMTATEAMADRRSHSITNWIGADAPERVPRIEALTPSGPGLLLLCTDGLWNYLSEPAELGGMIEALPPGAAPAAVARALADTALRRGGRDNITVVVVDIHPR